MTTDNGGPAFPADSENFGPKYCSPGMTLRDYFAAHAPPPPADFMRGEAEFGDSLAYQVRWRWAYADAMLKARATPRHGGSQ